MQAVRSLLLLGLLLSCGSPSPNDDAEAQAGPGPRVLDAAEWQRVESFTIRRSTGLFTSTDDCVQQIMEHCASICAHRYYEPQARQLVYLLDMTKRYDLCRIEEGIRRDTASERSGVCQVYQRLTPKRP